MRDMEAATARLRRAVERGERVAIFGDYDVDGACERGAAQRISRTPAAARRSSTSPTASPKATARTREAMAAFAARGASARRHRRLRRGQPRAVRRTPRRLGLDVVVFDHHQAPEALPEALAHRRSQPAGRSLGPRLSLRRRRRLHGAGRAEPGAARRAASSHGRSAPDLVAALDLVALATVADVVPLVGLNRAFVVKGLR